MTSTLHSQRCVVALAAAYGDAAFDAAEKALGRRGLVTAAALLIAVTAFSLAHAYRSRRTKTAVERLHPVRGKGYGIDPTTGEAACPRCSTGNHLVFMSDQGHALYCYVCNQGVLK